MKNNVKEFIISPTSSIIHGIKKTIITQKCDV
jgi:hypothetical protein